MNIGILGIGGVGGYFGGRLAKHYQGADTVRIIFIARQGTAEAIRSQGLQLITPEGTEIIHPFQTANNASEAGPLDVLICATKSYDLEEALKPLALSIHKETLILPLLNGVNARDTIRAIYPQAHILDGTVYINAQRLVPGVIEKTGSVEKLYFGSDNISREQLIPLQQVFKDAGIDSHLSENIQTDIWTKFVFTAGMATSTSFFDESLGKVLQNETHRNTLISLVEEAFAVALAKGITLPADIVIRTIEKMESMPFDATSSMHRDFMKGGKTEYLSLTKYIADLGDQLQLDTPVFDAVIPTLASRNNNR